MELPASSSWQSSASSSVLPQPFAFTYTLPLWCPSLSVEFKFLENNGHISFTFVPLTGFDEVIGTVRIFITENYWLIILISAVQRGFTIKLKKKKAALWTR